MWFSEVRRGSPDVLHTLGMVYASGPFVGMIQPVLIVLLILADGESINRPADGQEVGLGSWATSLR